MPEAHSEEVDIINHPPHYTFGKIEVIEIVDALDLDFYQGNIFKYLARWKHKGGIEDLLKCQFYLNRYIQVEQEKERERAEEDPASQITRNIQEELRRPR